MQRGLCDIVARAGHGLGGFGLLLRFAAGADSHAALREGLAEVLAALAVRPGLASATLLRSGLQAAVTVEQRIRGHDAVVDWALLATGYGRAQVEALATGVLARPELERRGATGVASSVYQLAHCVTHRDTAGPA